MYTVIKNQGIERALTMYHELYREYRASDDYVFEFEEYELNELGYTLMSEGMHEQAAAIFGLNMQMYPERSNVYDSYAEALLALGKRDLAIENYKKSLQMDFLNNNAYQKLSELGIRIPY